MNQLLFTLARLAQLQGEAVDRIALHEAAKAADGQAPHSQLDTVCRHPQVKPAKWPKTADASAVPTLLHQPVRGWGLLRGLNGRGQWIAEWLDSEAQKWMEVQLTQVTLQVCQIARVRLLKSYEASKSPVLRGGTN